MKMLNFTEKCVIHLKGIAIKRMLLGSLYTQFLKFHIIAHELHSAETLNHLQITPYMILLSSNNQCLIYFQWYKQKRTELS